jgi:Kinesin motor domain
MCFWSERERSRVQTTAVPLSSNIVQHNNSTIAGDHTPFEHCRKATMPVSEFKFDEVLRQQSTQGDVYAAAVEPVVADVLNGYNGTVMAYGQTGAPSHPARQTSCQTAS